MRISVFVMVLTFTLAIAMSATGQDRSTSAPSGSAPTAEKLSPGQTAMQNAAKAGKYIFIYFWKGDHTKAQVGWSTLQEGIQKNANWAACVSIQATDTAESKILDKFGISRAPLPLVLAIAPSGVVTKPFMEDFKADELASARVSACMEKCLKGLQNQKLVFLCVKRAARNGGQDEVPAGIKEFQDDQRFNSLTEVVFVNAEDKNEAQFLKELQVDTKNFTSATIFLAPPNVVVGKFESSATKEQFVNKLTALLSSPCGGGKCGPGGCGPKKYFFLRQSDQTRNRDPIYCPGTGAGAGA